MYTPANNIGYGAYTWYLRTWNLDGYSPWSSGLSFNFGQPEGLSPTGSVAAVQPTYSWNAVTGAEWYRIYIIKDGSLFLSQWLNAATDLVDPLNPTFDAPSPLPLGSYTWYIRAYSSSMGGYWSTSATFDRVP
jgi:hypothetical protein